MSPPTPTPQQALTIVRIIWGALLFGQLVVAGIFIYLTLDGGFAGSPDLHPLLGYVAVAVLVVAVPVAHIARQQTYKANWRGDAVSVNGYITGTIIYLGALEGAAIVGLIAVLVTGRLAPGLIVPAVAIILQIVNFPTGKPLQPAPPRIP
ncbi:MAG: hypothetical protein WD009_04055 [Phycisphaeraceae bacterium]